MLLRLIPKVFFDRLDEGLALFVEGLGFEVLHRDAGFAVVGREGIKAHVVESPDLAARDRPELSIETDAIEAMHAEVAGRRPDLLHPNLPRIRKQAWGAREFAVLDPTGVCVVFRQWGD